MKKIKIVFSSILLFLFFFSIFLSLQVPLETLKRFIRLGIQPKKETFSYIIPTRNLREGMIIAYRSYAEDVEGNWKATDLKYFKVNPISSSTEFSTQKTSTTQPIKGESILDKLYWPVVITLLLTLFIFLYLLVSGKQVEREEEEDEFEKLKEKWSRKPSQMLENRAVLSLLLLELL